MEVCTHVGTCGKSAGIACRNKKIGNTPWGKKHQKKVVPTDLSRDAVFGDPNAEPVAVPMARNRFSVWKWTINSQKDFSKMTPEDKERDMPAYCNTRSVISGIGIFSCTRVCTVCRNGPNGIFISISMGALGACWAINRLKLVNLYSTGSISVVYYWADFYWKRKNIGRCGSV
jgi:hypothetical protein